MTDAEHFFIEALDDLHRSIRSKDDYEVIRAAAIIRQLFLDDPDLAHVVNRNYHHKLRFEIHDIGAANFLGLQHSNSMRDLHFFLAGLSEYYRRGG